MLDDVLPRPWQYPTLLISDSFSFKSLKYALASDGPVTPEAVERHCEQYLSGQLAPSRKSEAVRQMGLLRWIVLCWIALCFVCLCIAIPMARACAC